MEVRLKGEVRFRKEVAVAVAVAAAVVVVRRRRRTRKAQSIQEVADRKELERWKMAAKMRLSQKLLFLILSFDLFSSSVFPAR